MTLTGEVKNGVVVFHNGGLPDGTRVRIEPIQSGSEADVNRMWSEVIGMAKRLPPDLAENHDHYLHGRPNA